MTQPIQHTVELDTARDASFGADIDDISSYVIGLEWHNGMNAPYQDISDEGTRLRVTLNNNSQIFTPKLVGSELLTNGDFSAWTSGDPDGWTVTGESGSDPEISEVASGRLHGEGGTGSCNFYSTSLPLIIRQNPDIEPGKPYAATIHISAMTGQKSGIQFSESAVLPVFSPIIREAGIHTFIFSSESVIGATFRIGASGAPFNITVDSVSVREVNAYYMMAKGMLVRLRGTYDGDTQQYYIGRILDIQYGVSPQSGQVQTCTLEIGEPTEDMIKANFVPPLQEDVTAKDVFQRIFDEGELAWPYKSTYAMLDTTGYNSELDNASCALYDHDALDLDDGQTPHAFVGDFADRGQGVSLYGYMRDVTEAECGGRLFWQGRTGKYTFHDRHHDMQNDTIAQTITTSDIVENPPVDFNSGRQLENRATLNYFVRKVGSPGTVVWTMANLPIQIKDGTQRKLTARYYIPDNEKAEVGIKDEIDPIPGADYVANASEDSSGQVTSELLTMTVQWGGSSAKIVFDNHSGQDMWITAAQLRATPLIAISEKAEAANPDSIAQYGDFETPLDLRLLSDRNTAEDYVQFRVNKFKAPITQFSSVSIFAQSNATTCEFAHERTVGDKITLTDTYTEHDADYVIVGEHHLVNIGQAPEHVATYILKPNSREIWARLDTAGYSELDSNARLAF